MGMTTETRSCSVGVEVVLMCPDCYALYKELVAQDERNFNKFMSEGVSQ